MGIPHVGIEISELLVANFGSLNLIFESSDESLQDIDGIGPKISNGIKDWNSIAKNRDLISELKNVGLSLERSNQEKFCLSQFFFMTLEKEEMKTTAKLVWK